MKFTYWDDSKKNRKPLFEVSTLSIVDADNKFEKSLGFNPTSKPTVSVKIEDTDKETKKESA
jgi:hypothetical protein